MATATSDPITTPPEETSVPTSSSLPEPMTEETGGLLGLEQLDSLEGFRIQILKNPLKNFKVNALANRYEVLDQSGERLFLATRDSIIWNGCPGRKRPLFQWLNLSGDPILTMTPCSRWECFAFGFGYLKVNLKSVQGYVGAGMGSVTRKECCARPKFVLRDPSGEIAAVILAPMCGDLCGFCRIGECCCNQDFRIVLPDGVTEIGLIQQKSTDMEVMGGLKCFTLDASFQGDLNPGLKTLILAGAFVIDDAFFGITPQGHRSTI